MSNTLKVKIPNNKDSIQYEKDIVNLNYIKKTLIALFPGLISTTDEIKLTTDSIVELKKLICKVDDVRRLIGIRPYKDLNNFYYELTKLDMYLYNNGTNDIVLK